MTTTNEARSRSMSWGATLFLMTTVGLSACAAKRSSETSPCPCAGSNVCCSSGVCAADESQCGNATLALAEESAGNWEGYLENFNFLSGSDAISINLAVAGTDVSGHVVFGQGDAPQPPTDLSQPWPPGAPDGGVMITNRSVIEGFAYEARDIRWESRRLKFRVDVADAWRPVCDLMASTPITVGDQSWVCPPSWGYTAGQGCKVGDTMVSDADCATLQARCQAGTDSGCICGETTCEATAQPVDIDVALRGDQGDGSAAGGLSANIRLSRTSQ